MTTSCFWFAKQCWTIVCWYHKSKRSFVQQRKLFHRWHFLTYRDNVLPSLSLFVLNRFVQFQRVPSSRKISYQSCGCNFSTINTPDVGSSSVSCLTSHRIVQSFRPRGGSRSTFVLKCLRPWHSITPGLQHRAWPTCDSDPHAVKATVHPFPRFT